MGGRKIIFDDEQLVEFYEREKNVWRVAKILGCNGMTVYKRLKELGKMRTSSEARMGNTNAAGKRSKKARENMSKVQMGKHHSLETKKKIG